MKHGSRLDYHNIVGCNEQIRSNFESGSYAYTYMLMPMRYVDEYIFNHIPGFGIQNVVEMANRMHLPCELVNGSEIEEIQKFKGMAVQYFYGNPGKLNFEDFYTIKIPARKRSKLPYYTFCFLRILYYQNSSTVNFFKKTMTVENPLDYYKALFDLNMGGSNSLLYAGKGQLSGYQVISNDIIDIIESDDTPKKLDHAQFLAPATFLTGDSYYMIPYNSETKSLANKVLAEKGHFLDSPEKQAFFIPKKAGESYEFVGRELIEYFCTVFLPERSTPLRVKGYNFINMYKKLEKPAVFTHAQVLSRHPTHNVFRKNAKLKFPRKTLIRLGSTTVPTTKFDIEINTVESIQKSSNKLLMKEAFDKHGVATADWFTMEGDHFYTRGDVGNKAVRLEDLPYPIIMKNIFGSRGEGNTKCDTPEQLAACIRKAKTLKNYIFEKFYNFAKEYRLHVSILGVFLVWRKLRRSDTPEAERWYFNNSNCNWVSPSHELFDCPINMVEVQREAVKALNAVGLTVGGVDLRIQSKGNSPKFIVVEINSACSQAEMTAESYINEFNKIVNELSKKNW